MQTKKAATRSMAAHYWRQVGILDTFWQKTFIAFVYPLNGIFVDSVSAGAAILSRYFEDPAVVEQELRFSPERFGALRNGGDGLRLKPRKMKFVECATAFHGAQKASQELDRLKSVNSIGFEELQIERIRRRARSALPKASPTALKRLIKRKL